MQFLLQIVADIVDARLISFVSFTPEGVQYCVSTMATRFQYGLVMVMVVAGTLSTVSNT